MISFFIGENMLALEHGLWESRDLILLSEVDLVDRLVNFALESVLEWGNLVVLLHGVSWHVVGVQVGAQLVVSVHVNFLLQLSANIFVSVVSAKMLVELGILGSWFSLSGSRFFLFFLSWLLLNKVVLVSILSLLVELDDQIMLLGSCQWHFF